MDLREDNLKKGAIYLVLGESFLVAMAAVFKGIDNNLNFETKVFFRNFFGWLFVLMILLLRNKLDLKTKVIKWHFFRSFMGLSGMYGFFYVIAHMKLAEASLVKLTAPFFLPIIVFIWLGERIMINHFIALIIGFIGVVVFLQPGTDNFQPIAFIGLFAALLQSTAKVTIRKMALTEPYLRVIFYFGLFGTFLSLIPALLNWQTPTVEVLFLLILMGMFGTFGQILITKAYQISSPGKVGVYTYSSLIVSSLIGWFIWNESLSLNIIAGSALIIIAGSLNLYKK